MKLLLLLLLLIPGCTVVSANRTFPKLDWYWSADAKAQRSPSTGKVCVSLNVLPDPSTLTNDVPTRWYVESYTCSAYSDAHTLFISFPMTTPKTYGLFVSTNLLTWKISSIYVPNPGVSNI